MCSKKYINKLLNLFDKIPVSMFPMKSRCDESFLREMKDYIIWETIDNTDSFSVEFIREFAKELDLKHRRLRNEIKNEFNNVE